MTTKKLTMQEFRNLSAKEKGAIIAQEMVANLNNPANHGKSI